MTTVEQWCADRRPPVSSDSVGIDPEAPGNALDRDRPTLLDVQVDPGAVPPVIAE